MIRVIELAGAVHAGRLCQIVNLCFLNSVLTNLTGLS